MAFFARIREEQDGTFTVIAGPSENLVKQDIHDKVVPAMPTYPQNFDLLFPTYIGPTLEVRTMENGSKFVAMLYTPVESEISSVKKMFIDRVSPIFDVIDQKSTRAVRALIVANATGTVPLQADIDMAKLCDETAAANRAIIAKINGIGTLQELRDKQGEFTPVNPWAPKDDVRM